MTVPRVSIRTIADLTTEPRVVVDNLLFEWLGLLRCYSGRFRLTFRDHEVIDLCPDETLVMYPGHYVTITAVKPENRLVYGIFEGEDVESYFDGFGFFDLAKGRTTKREMSVWTSLRRDGALSDKTDVLKTVHAEMRTSCGQMAFDAFCEIDQGLRNGKAVAVGTLCATLGVSRVYLNRIFAATVGISPSAYIRQRQIQRVRRLMSTPDLRISEIAHRVGIDTAQRFSAFVKRMTGLSPRDLRLSLQMNKVL